jgi:multicomponent K+:H+ antiporter subunit A
VQAVLGADKPAYRLALWHGLNVPLFMSILALAGGTALYWLLRKRLADVEGTPLLPPIDGRRVFERALDASRRGARRLEALLSTRRLQPQLRWLVVLTAVSVSWPVIRHGLAPGDTALSPFDPIFALLWIVGGACAIGAAVQAKFHRLVAILLAGGAGLVTCVTFIWFSAPDLALTQLLVEIVTTVLLLLGLRWLPKRIPFAPTLAGALAALPDWPDWLMRQ